MGTEKGKERALCTLECLQTQYIPPISDPPPPPPSRLYKDAQKLLQRLTQEKKLDEMLASAIKTRSKAPILSAVQAAKGMDPPYTPPLLKDAEDMLVRIEKEEGVTAGLRKVRASARA